VKRCPQCATEFPDKYRFCQYDRTALLEVEVSPVQEAQPEQATQVESLNSPASQPETETRRTYPLVLAWSKRHIFLLSSIIIGVIVLVVLYYAFIKPKPDADGSQAALPFKNCQTSFQAKIDAAYQTFLKEFAGKNYQRRSDAQQRIDELLGNDRNGYDKCIQAAETQYQTLATRYSDLTDTQEFLNAFSAAGGERKAAGDLESSSSFYSQIDQKLVSIRGAYPDSQRIMNDLLGRGMDGWNFENTAEFKEMKIVDTRTYPDVLILRTHLYLEGYNTKDLKFAVIDVVYSLNPDGEWVYQSLTQLLLTTPDANYFIGNNIFLIGKWRWESNYATYNEDGTWNGNWDNGFEAAGNWRIVNGNLVLTKDGQTWMNLKIVQFTKNELVVGENPPARAVRVQ
jgi:hypothetical protein